MAIPIPTPLIEFILLGPLDDRRQLQDSPILGDVWVEFGRQPDARVDLLIAPYRGQHAGGVADLLDKELHPDPKSDAKDEANIAFLQGVIAARLTFRQLMRHVAPKTKWWQSRKKEDSVPTQPDLQQGGQTPQTNVAAVRQVINYPGDLKKLLDEIIQAAIEWNTKKGKRSLQDVPSLERFLALTALILWAGSFTPKKPGRTLSSEEQINHVLNRAKTNVDQVVQLLTELAEEMVRDQQIQKQKATAETDETEDVPLVYQVSLNRVAVPAIAKSIAAVKADAATTLFKVDSSDISWAVIDSGIDGNHPALRGKNGESRVKQSFDFKNYRKIVSLSNTREAVRKRNIEALLADKD